MRWLASLRWRTVIAIAIGWIVLIVTVAAIGAAIVLRQFYGRADSGSGGLAAIGFNFGMETRGWFYLLGPPLAIIALRFAAGAIFRGR